VGIVVGSSYGAESFSGLMKLGELKAFNMQVVVVEPHRWMKRLELAIFLLAVSFVHGDEPVATEPRPSLGSGSGISYRNEKIPTGPLSIHIAKVDRSRSDLSLTTTLAKGTVLDLSTLSDQIKTLQSSGAKVLAGINGDFYRTEREAFAGDPLGFQVMQGELVSGGITNRPAFWLDALGQPHLGVVDSQFEVVLPNGRKLPFQFNEERLRGTIRLYTPRLGSSTQTAGGREVVLEKAMGEESWLPLKPCHTYRGRVTAIREDGNSPLMPGRMVLSFDPSAVGLDYPFKIGDRVEISTRTVPETLNSDTAIGGGPTLLHEGKLADFKSNGDRHPRSAFGWNNDYWFFVEVDGRQSNLSVGMTIKELAEYLQKLGVQEAINLDGGGSATLWMFGQVVNSPCYGYERNTANGLVVMKKDTLRREPD
jgi:large repetitive protein